MPPDRTTLAAFAGAVVLGGTNFVAVRLSNETLDPFYGAALRFGCAALLLYAIAALRRIPLPRSRALIGASLYGLLGFGVAYAGLYYALVGLPAGTASLILAAVPLLTLILAVVHRQERFSTRALIGGFLAIVGIAVLSADSLQGGDLDPKYLLGSLVGSLAVAESAVLIKAFPRADPITTNAVGMTAGTILLVLVSLVAGEAWELPSAGATWFVLAWLVIGGSVGLFVLVLYVIARWTASASVYVLTLMPVVAVTLGAVMLDEAVTSGVITGGVIVLIAVYIGALSQPTVTSSESPTSAQVLPPR